MSEPILTPSTAEIVRALTQRVRQIEGAQSVASGSVVSSGSAALDALLPGKAFRRGTLVEWLSSGGGSGASTLALMIARQACREGGALVVVDRQRSFYPPAAAALGIDLERSIVVRPLRDGDDTWTVDQVLRSVGVAAVLSWPEKLCDRTFRRLQLAAESSGVLGLLVRPDSVRSQPSWAELRLLVRPLLSDPRPGAAARRRLRVELLRCRRGICGGAVELEIDEETGTLYEQSAVYLAPALAAGAPRRRSAGA
jgi:protein ImuA